MTKTWFITGGTPGGFGHACADAALEQGDQVVLTARRPEELDDWSAEHGERALVMPLDVTDGAQIEAAVAAALEHFGQVDVLVNSAGRGWLGSIEGTEDAVVRRLFELNFFAVVAVTRAVLPGMRARRSGTVVNMSSVAGLVGTPGFGFYSASKFAVEGMTEVLRHEVEPFGIEVMAVEPGSFRTNAYAGFAEEPVGDIDDYRPQLEALHAQFVDQDGRQPGDPQRGARALVEAARRSRPPHQLVLGGGGYDRVTAHLEEVLAAIRGQEAASRGADFPPDESAHQREEPL